MESNCLKQKKWSPTFELCRLRIPQSDHLFKGGIDLLGRGNVLPWRCTLAHIHFEIERLYGLKSCQSAHRSYGQCRVAWRNEAPIGTRICIQTEMRERRMAQKDEIDRRSQTALERSAIKELMMSRIAELLTSSGHRQRSTLSPRRRERIRASHNQRES